MVITELQATPGSVGLALSCDDARHWIGSTIIPTIDFELPPHRVRGVGAYSSE